MKKVENEKIEKLFKKVNKYNWDDGFEWLYEVIQLDYCDRGTALMIYWLSRPEWFCQYQQETEIKPWEEENYKFIRFVEKMYPSISTEYIIYDPKDDKQIGLYTGDFAIKSTLPPIMYQTTRGQVYYKDIV